MQQYITLSKKQVETLQDFFSWDYIEILYWGGARWWKSFLIWILLAIWVAAMPNSSWLISRTKLSELQATTMSTFFQVLKQLWFWHKSYKDNIRDKKHLEFLNGSKVYVIQVDNEPSDPEFDRLGSYSYTWAFLDEGQQMVTKVRSVLAGRFSETSWFFNFQVDKPKNWELDLDNIWYSLQIKVVWEAVFDPKDFKTDKSEIKEVVRQWKHYCAIVDYFDLKIPYSITEIKDEWTKLTLTAVWKFKATTLISCNPWKNFTYTDFYKPFKRGKLEWDEFKYMKWTTYDWTVLKRKFIQALVTDNPFVDRSYTHQLEISEDEITKQRLLYWNFEYDDDPTLIFNKTIVDNLYISKPNDNSIHYITCDVARQGKDYTVIMVWKWLEVIDTITIKQADLKEQSKFILELSDKYNVPMERIIVDEIWVGWWLVDMLGCKWFIANAMALHPISSKLLSYKKRNYANLRTQAYFYLLKYMQEWKITISNMPPSIRELLNDELLFIRQKNIDWDTKIQLQSKSDMKALLGRSPDYSDCLSFRFWWIIKDHYEWNEIEEDKKDDLVDLLENDEEEQDEDKFKEIDINIYD